jgi:ribosomal protein L37AE/L43A
MSDNGLLCSTCRHRLGVDELATCRACVADTRAHLGAIEHAYRLLPALLVSLGSNAPQPGQTRSNEHPMPGGDALVLLGPGSSALEALRRLRAAEATGKPHDEPAWGADDRGHDAPSAAYELGRWVSDWALARHEPPAAPRDVTEAVVYLRRRLPWAAAHHPGFAEFTLDMRALRQRIERVAGLDDRPERAGVPCFDCGGDLERRYGHKGREDDWTCRRCNRVYDQAAYLLAVRANLEAAR